MNDIYTEILLFEIKKQVPTVVYDSTSSWEQNAHITVLHSVPPEDLHKDPNALLGYFVDKLKTCLLPGDVMRSAKVGSISHINLRTVCPFLLNVRETMEDLIDHSDSSFEALAALEQKSAKLKEPAHFIQLRGQFDPDKLGQLPLYSFSAYGENTFRSADYAAFCKKIGSL